MISNDLANNLNSLYRNILNKKNEAPADPKKQGPEAEAQAAANGETATQAAKKTSKGILDAYERSKNPNAAKPADKDTAELTPEEKRQASLARIMKQIEEEEAQRYPNRTNNANNAHGANGAKKTETEASSDVITVKDPAEVAEKDGMGALLNDLPLFNEFKTSLMDAFRSMDSASYGAISAQYELNISSMQYIADAAGNYQSKETSFNLKIDLNYVKAGAGSMSGSEIADALEKADDFESFVAALQSVTGGAAPDQANGKGNDAVDGPDANQGKGNDKNKGVDENNPLAAFLDDNGRPMSANQIMNNAFKNMTPDKILSGLQDYFSPEKTAGRIVDFATAFFPMSEAYKKNGDTPEAREQFGEMMREAINKGFDQAMGTLGKVPDNTQAGIDKTHELAMQGIDDFIKNGIDKNKEEQQNNLRDYAFSFSMEMSYTEKTVSVSNYNSRGQTQGAQPTSSALNTEA